MWAAMITRCGDGADLPFDDDEEEEEASPLERGHPACCYDLRLPLLNMRSSLDLIGYDCE